MTKAYIGIDPGLNGAAVALDEYGEILGWKALPHLKEIPCYRKDRHRSVLDVTLLEAWFRSFTQIERICVEESPPFSMGVTSAYTSGFNSGMLHGLCVSWMGIPRSYMKHGQPLADILDTESWFSTVSPKVWQSNLFGAHEGKWSKDNSIKYAQERHGKLTMFEKPKKTSDGFSDACHIAEWGRQCVLECPDWGILL